MVATSTAAAADAGLAALHAGGTAVDAAVAAAAASAVTEPNSTGLGGDLCALIWHDGRLHGINATGPSPAGLTAEAVGASGIDDYGPRSITVPGQISGWQVLVDRFGTLSLADVLAPGIEYAENGFTVTASAAAGWSTAFETYMRFAGKPWVKAWFDEFTVDGSPPRAGETWSSPTQAATLRTIAARGAADFYRGGLAAEIVDEVRRHGGLLSADDLREFEVEWADPISVRFRGHDVWSLPPNSQGLIALQALGILDQLSPTPDPVDFVHRQIEAIKLAFADGHRAIADPTATDTEVAGLLKGRYLRDRSAEIDHRAKNFDAGVPARGGTVYIATADDRDGFCSLIQSNFLRFGSGVVVPGTGIALHNRARAFSLDPHHPNVVGPRKRPFHTIMPGFVTSGDEPVGPFGVMGAAMQPQGMVQLMTRSLDLGSSPQQALDAPRWRWDGDLRLSVEAGWDADILAGLDTRGHDVSVHESTGAGYGRGQIIWRDPVTGILRGGTDPRVDGGIAQW